MSISTLINEVESTLKGYVKTTVHVILIPIISALKAIDAGVVHLISEFSKV